MPPSLEAPLELEALLERVLLCRGLDLYACWQRTPEAGLPTIAS